MLVNIKGFNDMKKIIILITTIMMLLGCGDKEVKYYELQKVNKILTDNVKKEDVIFMNLSKDSFMSYISIKKYTNNKIIKIWSSYSYSDYNYGRLEGEEFNVKYFNYKIVDNNLDMIENLVDIVQNNNFKYMVKKGKVYTKEKYIEDMEYYKTVSEQVSNYMEIINEIENQIKTKNKSWSDKEKPLVIKIQ
jgi:hypothetical protein